MLYSPIDCYIVSWACSGLTLSQPTDVHPNDSTPVDDKHHLSSDAIVLAYLKQLIILRDRMILSPEHPQSGVQPRHAGHGDFRRYALAPGSELRCTPVPAPVCSLTSTSTIPRDRPPNREKATVGEQPHLSHRR